MIANWKLELPMVLYLWCFTQVQTRTWCILMKPLKKNSSLSSLWQFMKPLGCDDRLSSMRAHWYDTQASGASLSQISASHFTLARVIDRISLISFFSKINNLTRARGWGIYLCHRWLLYHFYSDILSYSEPVSASSNVQEVHFFFF